MRTRACVLCPVLSAVMPANARLSDRAMPWPERTVAGGLREPAPRTAAFSTCTASDSESRRAIGVPAERVQHRWLGLRPELRLAGGAPTDAEPGLAAVQPLHASPEAVDHNGLIAVHQLSRTCPKRPVRIALSRGYLMRHTHGRARLTALRGRTVRRGHHPLRGRAPLRSFDPSAGASPGSRSSVRREPLPPTWTALALVQAAVRHRSQRPASAARPPCRAALDS